MYVKIGNYGDFIKKRGPFCTSHPQIIEGFLWKNRADHQQIKPRKQVNQSLATSNKDKTDFFFIFGKQMVDK
jgi:hypothetical protein